MVYVPAEVPVGVGFVGAGEFPPPQAHNINANTGASLHRVLIDCDALNANTSAKHPRIASGQSNNGFSNRGSHRPEWAVVVTLTVNVEGVVALSGTLVGTKQVAPVGAPVHLRVAVPLIPAPPIDIGYVAVVPAVTVADEDPPEATPSPTLGGVPVPPPEPVPDPPLAELPVSATVCGLSGALSAIVSVPVCVLSAVGVNVT